MVMVRRYWGQPCAVAVRHSLPHLAGLMHSWCDRLEQPFLFTVPNYETEEAENNYLGLSAPVECMLTHSVNVHV